jgi:hypothetical protein
VGVDVGVGVGGWREKGRKEGAHEGVGFCSVMTVLEGLIVCLYMYVSIGVCMYVRLIILITSSSHNKHLPLPPD